MPPIEVRQQAGEYQRTHKDASIVSAFIAGWSFAQQKPYLDATMVDDTPVYDETPNVHPISDKKPTKEQKMAILNNRKQKFHDSLVPFVEQYGTDMIEKFFDYWSEFNRSCTKMRFEMEKTWELSRRLAYWNNRNKERTYNGNRTTANAVQQRFAEYAEDIRNIRKA